MIIIGTKFKKKFAIVEFSHIYITNTNTLQAFKNTFAIIIIKKYFFYLQIISA